MATPVVLPKFSMTMEAGTIVRWLKAEGDAVREGEPIAEVMTEKVNMEVDAPVSGVLLSILARVGEVVPVTQVIAYVGIPGEDLGTAIAAPPVAGGPPVRSSAGAPAPRPSRPAGTVAATPIARRLARDAGLDLAAIRGSGPGGRITEADVRAAAAAPLPPAPPAQDTRVPLSGRRRAIAEGVGRSAREIPHIYLTREIDMSAAEAARGAASYTAVIVWAAARALRAHPMLRAKLDGDHVAVQGAIHIGIAVDAPQGLIVPVVRDADRKDLAALAREVDVLAQRGRDERLTPDDVVGGTFTVSNLGMLGVDEFTALINRSESAILAVGAVRARPWVVGRDAIAIRSTCRVTLALDHRIADGAAGARFLDELARHLEAFTG